MKLSKYSSAYLAIFLYLAFIALGSQLSGAVANTAVGIGGVKPALGSLTYLISLALSVTVVFLGVRRLEMVLREGEASSSSQ